MDTIIKNRTKYIGGSDVPVLFGLSKFKTRKTLIEEYKNNTTTNNDSKYTKYGQYMERKIRSYFNKLSFKKYKPKCRIIKKLKIRGNTDGIFGDSIIEIKTNNGNHKNTIDYELQMQLYMYIFNCNKGYLLEYTRPSDFYKGFGLNLNKDDFNLIFNKNNLKIKEIQRNDEIINEILKEIKKFWGEVSNG